MRFALIGYGAWGRFHARAISKVAGAELVAICCKSAATAAAAREAHPDLAVVGDYRELVAMDGIDVVDIAAPTHVHAEMAIAALDHGKDVLVEKPMALDVGECDAMIAAAQRNGRVLSVGHKLRLSSQWGRIKDIIDAGEIGMPLYANISLFRFPYRKGAEDWRWTRAAVGSWILEEPVHFFDFAMWYFERWGAPISVTAFANSKGRGPGLYDNFTAILRFPENIYATITQTIAAFAYHQLIEVVGHDGAVRAWWSGEKDRTFQPEFGLELKRRGATAPETVALAASGEVFELEEEIRRVISAFAARKPLVGGAEAKSRIALCAAAEQSIEEGREIFLT